MYTFQILDFYLSIIEELYSSIWNFINFFLGFFMYTLHFSNFQSLIRREEFTYGQFEELYSSIRNFINLFLGFFLRNENGCTLFKFLLIYNRRIIFFDSKLSIISSLNFSCTLFKFPIFSIEKNLLIDNRRIPFRKRHFSNFQFLIGISSSNLANCPKRQ